jgi:SRSO17 transposase
MGSKESDLNRWKVLRDAEYSSDPEVRSRATAEVRSLGKHLWEDHHVASPDTEAPPSSQPWLDPEDRD